MLRETDIAAAAAAWLEQCGLEVYQEVELLLRDGIRDHNGRADLVGRSVAGELEVVESKRDLSFDLFAQGDRWQGYASRIWLAVPLARRTEGREEAFRVARDFYGMGVLEVGDTGVKMRVQAPHHLISKWTLRDSLRPEHKTAAKGGAPAGGQVTSYSLTCEALAKYVAAHEGCTLAEAVEAISHHYRNKLSAKSSLSKWIRAGKIEGVHWGWRGRLWSSREAERGAA